MRTFLLAYTLLFCMALSAFGQSAKFWLFFADKGDTTGYDFNQLFTQDCWERRKQNDVSISWTDYPVYEKYLRQLETYGVKPLHSSRWLNGASAHLNLEQLITVQSLPFIKEIRPVRLQKIADEEMCAADTTEDDLSDHYLQCKMMGLNELHENNQWGQNIKIAVFDNGFKSIDQLKAFESVFKEGRILGTFDYVDRDSSVFDTGTHGNKVLSIICANELNGLKGAARKAKFYLFRTENDASETQREEDAWVAAAEHADALGAQIFQTSLGYSVFDNDEGNYTYAGMDGNTAIITRAADLAASKGILVINAAGNEGRESPGSWKYVIAPADGDSVLACGAVDRSGTRTDFSSQGPTYDGRIKPDIMAMGGKTTFIDENGARKTGNGTSFAAPLITGFAACLWQTNPKAKAMDVYRAIIRSADRFYSPNNLYGYGLPNANRALNILQGNVLPEAFTVFPNPVDRSFTVLGNDVRNKQEVEIRLIDLSGREVFKTTFTMEPFSPAFTVSRNEFNLYLPDGLYTLILKNSGDQNILLRKNLVFQKLN